MSAPFLDAGTFGNAGAHLAALLIGSAFGFTLERAGLGSARKLAGQFLLTDLTVFKVMFSAIVTAMLGLFWLSRLGLLDLSRVYVPETFLLPQLAGGLLFGAGFVVCSLCPGTSCVAAAPGRLDGLFVMMGMFAGVLATGLAFPSLQHFYESTSRGAATLPELLHVSYGVVAPHRRAGSGRLSRGGMARGPRMNARVARRALAVIAMVAGGLAPFAGSRESRAPMVIDVATLAHEVALEEDHITAIKLAQWIRSRKPGLRVLDLRSQNAFSEYHVPGSKRIALDELSTTRFKGDETLVLISDGGAHAAQAWVFLRAMGNHSVFFLRGGLNEWIGEVMNPVLASDASAGEKAAFATVADTSRYFGGVPRIGMASTSPHSASETSRDTPRDKSHNDPAAIRRRGC